jgi:large subunit ribosomal protein L18
MVSNKTRNQARSARHFRVRAKIKGTSDCPRLSVFRSIKNISLQVIDDVTGKTICQANSEELKKSKAKVDGRDGKVALAFLTGKKIAERAKENGIEKIVFDRGGYRYHGRVAAVADGAREGGLKF